jgi:2-haloalkanoic acid dehalogenase type II
VEPSRPVLLSFDIFGTVVDWRQGLLRALAAAGVPAARAGAAFDAIVDAQGRLEQAGPGRRYRSLVAESVRQVLGLAAPDADAVADTVGRWPPFPDSAAALARLGRIAPLVALTNSDADQGRAVRDALPGVRWAHWLCAEDTGAYKPDPRVWDACAARTGVSPAPAWWHVSAYADYDLGEAARRGLTTVYVERPHRRAGPATLVVPDLAALADRLESA